VRSALGSGAEQGALRAAFKELAAREVVKVVVTKHALSRLAERKAKDYGKFDRFVLESIVANTVRDGRYRVGSRDVVIATRKYTLICAVEGGALVVKTVLRTDKEKWERFSRAPRAPWRSVVVFLRPSKPP
jgi:hypothetical protein